MLLADNRDCTDPALNLALEEYVLRTFRSQGSILILYINTTAVVLGKHQNVAAEANLPVCDALHVPVLRRISGGGTVVHDLGNLNFSFITDQTMKNVNNYHLFVQPIVELLRDYRIPAELDKNNNIVAGGKKVSGNAQFVTGGRLLTHGTLLVHSNLERIREVLTPGKNKKVLSRASRSRPAAIANINTFRSGPEISVKEMSTALRAKLLGDNPHKLKLTKNDWNKIQLLANKKYRSEQWNYGRSPESEVELVRKGNRIRFHLKDGRIDWLRVENNPDLEAKLQRFAGMPYHVARLRNKAEALEGKTGLSPNEILSLLF